jgi:hypothetical protein
VLAWLAQLGIGEIVGKIADAYTARENAQTDQARIAADERIKSLEAQRDAIVAEAGNRINALVRAFLTIPFGIFIWKVVVWDKVLGWGSTDDLSPNLWYAFWVVLGFYTLTRIVGSRQ